MRSLVFNIVYYLGTVVWAVLILIAGLFGGGALMRRLIVGYCRSVQFGMRVIAGINIEVRGAERLKRNGGYLIAAKHMSDLDPMILYPLAPDLTALAKKELFRIPLIGQILKAIGIIRIDRQAGNAHQQMPEVIAQIKEQQCPLLVYPEGTRSYVGERKKLKSGIFHLQENGGLDVVTVATNTGYHWPKGSLVRRPGTVVMEVQGPLPKGLDKEKFMAVIEKNVLDRSEEIMREIDGVEPAGKQSKTAA